MSKETWKDVFRNQTDSGRFWQNLFKDDFDKHLFLDRSDAVYICKKAQADTYENIIESLRNKVNPEVLIELEQKLKQHWENDDSALGMTNN